MGSSPLSTLWVTLWSLLAFLTILVLFSLAAGVFSEDLTVLVADPDPGADQVCPQTDTCRHRLASMHC